MGAVVLIHAAGPGEKTFLAEPNWLSDSGAAVFASQWARFSVPLFLILSGYGLALSEANRDAPPTLRQFWKRRGERIVLPYLVWSVGTYAWMGGFAGGDISKLPIALLTGKADYHLYFIAFLLQAYMLWPILRRATWSFVICLLAVQVFFSSPVHVIYPDRLDIPGWVIAHWAGYFALGAKLGRSASPAPRAPLIPIVFSLVLLSVLLMEYNYWAQRLPDPGWFNHFSRVSVIAYSLGVVWLWQTSADSWTKALISWRLDRIVSRGAQLTFCVYFVHVWILRGLDTAGLGFGGTAALAVIGSFGVAYLLDRGLTGEWSRWPRRCLGL